MLPPLSVPTFLANPARWNEFVREEGDAELGGALKELARTLPWFVEAALAKALGPLVGQRVADAGRRLLAFPEYAAQRVTEGVTSYARDEAGLLARSAQMRQFTRRCRRRRGAQSTRCSVASTHCPRAPLRASRSRCKR